jgi:glycosyltransferase involved in cell wall biosynthesis
MKVAIIHYWLVGMRGGEKVVEALCRMFPGSTLFTHVYNPAAVSDFIRSQDVRTSFIDKLPRSARLYKSYLPLMPLALEQLDLRGYDLIISSESGPAKGVIPPPHSVHLCYCHSPMRYLWNMFHDYHEQAGMLTRFVMPPLAHYLRNWDALSAMRVDGFIANSATVKARIHRYYGRHADVVHPPVDVEAFDVLPPSELGDYFLMVGELVRYKRPDLAVEAFNRLGLKLVVIGGGEMLGEIRRLAGPTIEVLGSQPFDVLKHHYARCRALIFPGEEDFGIVPVEAMASGRPVLAYGRGGACETVECGISGLFFYEQNVESIIGAVRQMQSMSFDPEVISKRAGRFSSSQFTSRITELVDRAMSSGGQETAAPAPMVPHAA